MLTWPNARRRWYSTSYWPSAYSSSTNHRAATISQQPMRRSLSLNYPWFIVRARWLIGKFWICGYLSGITVVWPRQPFDFRGKHLKWRQKVTYTDLTELQDGFLYTYHIYFCCFFPIHFEFIFNMFFCEYSWYYVEWTCINPRGGLMFK